MHTRKIRCLMARITSHPVNPVAVLAPFYVLKMHMTVVSLKGCITCGMTILAAGRGQDTINLQEAGARSIYVWLGRTGCQRSYKQGRSCAEPKDCEHVSYCLFVSPTPVFFARSECSHEFTSSRARSLARIGSLRMRLPVTAKIAFASAGATGGTPGSPTPVGFSVLGTICTSISGDSKIRSIW